MAFNQVSTEPQLTTQVVAADTRAVADLVVVAQAVVALVELTLVAVVVVD